MQEGTLGALGGPASTRATIQEEQQPQQPTGTIRGSFGGTMVSHADFGGTMVVNEDGPDVPNVIHAVQEPADNPSGTMVVSSALSQNSLNQSAGTGNYMAALHAAASANDG